MTSPLFLYQCRVSFFLVKHWLPIVVSTRLAVNDSTRRAFSPKESFGHFDGELTFTPFDKFYRKRIENRLVEKESYYFSISAF
jgi:hypothetical protein